MRVIKKDGTLEEFDGQKIVNAVTKSASRVMVNITDSEFHDIVAAVIRIIQEKGLEEIPVSEMHNIMEQVLEDFNPAVAKSYKDYRNYKKDFVHLMDEVYIKSQSSPLMRGEWIEIQANPEYSTTKPVSPRARGSGLKYRDFRHVS